MPGEGSACTEDLMEFTETKRFIKKVPPSGGAPAYKLTLPHQVVHKHLLHLIDVDFELAPANDAQQTWQGSIVPRRNKDRSEYTLQGWKLYAQAHNIQSGDQVSFELISPRRLVLQVLNLDIQPSAIVRKSCDSRMTNCKSLSKSPRHESPSREPVPCNPPPFADPMEELLSSSLGGEAIDEEWRSLSNSSIEASKISKDDSSNRLSRHRSSMASADNVVPTTPSTAKKPLNIFRPLLNTSVKPDPSFDMSFPLCNIDTSTSFETTHPSIFSDLLQDVPADEISPGISHSSAQHSPFNFDSSFDMLPIHKPSHPHLPVSESDLSSSLDIFNGDALDIEARMHDKARSPAAEDAIQTLQRRLDEQTREALRAVIGLEQCAMSLAGLPNNSGKGTEDAHSRMFKMLNKLKGNLWRMLVLTVTDDAHA